MATDIAISFDTTGSMNSIMQQVRRQVEDTVNELFESVPDLRVSIIAHGDYCDAMSSYLSKHIELTSDQKKIVSFVKSTGSTCGYSAEEAYEHVLWLARSLNWRADATKALVMIGDAHCHPESRWGTKECGQVINPRRLDWKNEAKLLHNNFGVKVFSVHALARYRRGSAFFWRGMAEATSGKYLTLDDFPEIVATLKLLTYTQTDKAPDLVNQYVESLVTTKKMTSGLADTVAELTGMERPTVTKMSLGGGGGSTRSTSTRTRRVATTVSEADLEAYGDVSLEPVPPGRFQILEVEKDTDIQKMVVANVGEGSFQKGSGYYEFGRGGPKGKGKSVKVQSYKNVVLVDKTSGDLWTGDAARKLIGLPKDKDYTLSPSKAGDFLDQYFVFIQSTSYNRKLLANTLFLYEVAEFAEAA